MTREELIELIRFNLGAPAVKIEIDETQWDPILKCAKLWFRSKKGVFKFTRVQVPEGSDEIALPVDALEVIDVVFPSQRDLYSQAMGLSELVPSYLFGFNGIGSVGGGWDVSLYVQHIQSMSTRRRIFSGDPMWQQRRNSQENTLIVKSGGCSPGNEIVIYYKANDFTIESLSGRDEDLFYRYASALAKMVLARIRGKYGSYPAAGGPVQMDADVLLQESKEEREKLDEEIYGSQGNPGGITRG